MLTCSSSLVQSSVFRSSKLDDLATNHGAYEITTLLSALQEELTLILPVVEAAG